jgi:glycosyltransferase involved in cell wall biosynthesis
MRVLSRKAEVQVFYPYSVYPAWLKPRSRAYEYRDPSYSLPDVKVSYYDYSVLPLISRPLNGWLAMRAILPHVRDFAPDLIFNYFLYPDGYAAMKIGRALSVPVVVMSVGSDLHSIRDRITAMHTRTVLRNADFSLAISEDLRQRSIAMGALPAKTRTVGSGCDLSVFHPRDRAEARQRLGIDPQAEAVVYIGRMDVRKGLRELVEASADLHAAHPKLQVFLVGSGPDRPILEGAIQTRSASGYIHLMPACPFDEVAVWMAAADLVTLPSYAEGCPSVVLEALASGRPVVATRVGGIPEIMNEECGRLVAPRDAGALAQALAAVLDQSWDAATISAYGSRSWEDVADDLLEVFEPLVAARRS